MIFLSIATILGMAAVFIFVRWKSRECLKCTCIASFMLICTIFLSNVLYTGYLNFDADSSDARAAISLAICNPIENASIIPEAVSCAPTLTAYGVDLIISSGRILSDEEIKKFVRRVRRLKPIITSGRIQVSFKHYQVKSTTSGLTKEGVPTHSTRYTTEIYKTVNL